MADSIPETMTCIEIAEPGGPEVLTPATRPVPASAAGEVLVRVAAAGINAPDVLQRKGAYPPPKGASDIPGLEIAGTVAALGDGVDGWAVGDTLCAVVTGGGYAEYCPAPAPQCLPVPAGLGMAEAAAVPETFFTVWTNVFERGALKPGESLLVHGGAGGIGTTAIQVASRLGGRVFATAGTDEKCAACERLGAERGINYRTEDFVAAVKEATGGRGVNVVLDMIGGDYVARNIAALAADGRLVNIAFRDGARVEIDLMPVMLKRLVLTGSTLRIRPVERKGEIARALAEHVWPLLAAGDIAPLIHATLPLADAAEGHRMMEASEHTGKIVLVTGAV